MAGSVDITETGIDLSTAESVPPIEIRLSAKGASVDGVVLDKDGKPVIGSMVLMLPQPYDPEKASVPMYRKSTTTDQTGHFSLKAIAPGDLASALGADQIDSLAAHSGLSRDDLLKGLSQYLPKVVDHLTPDGRLPTDDEVSGRL